MWMRAVLPRLLGGGRGALSVDLEPPPSERVEDRSRLREVSARGSGFHHFRRRECEEHVGIEQALSGEAIESGVAESRHGAPWLRRAHRLLVHAPRCLNSIPSGPTLGPVRAAEQARRLRVRAERGGTGEGASGREMRGHLCAA